MMNFPEGGVPTFGIPIATDGTAACIADSFSSGE